MTNLTFNDSQITQREDNYVNATEMCKANGTRVANWTRLKSTQDYISSLSTVTQMCVTLLIEQNEDSTWVHPLLAIQLGRWISPEFAIWCDMHIKTLMETGKTEIVETKPVVKELPYHSYLKDLEAMMILAPEDEVLRQLVREKMVDELSDKYGNQPLLDSSPQLKEYTIAKVRATQLGYTMKRIGSGSALGKYVGKRVESAYKQQVGRYPVKHYEINDELDTAIHSYFQTR